MYNNIFYFKKINKIGGTEQFLYEIATKYKDWDITVFFDAADINQLKRLRKYVRCQKRVKGEKVICKRAFFNFNIDMIDDVVSTENYYAFVSHANYEELGYKPPIDHPKLTHFFGVSQFATDKLNEYGKKLGLNFTAKKCYDPMTLEPKEKVPILVSACRLNDKVKGGERTLKLIQALDRYCLRNNRHYLFLIFTNHTNFKLPSPNAVYMQPRVDVRPYIAMADWVVQLSNDMETFCYTTNEANGYGVPIVTTPLSVYNELPVTDNERIVLDWDCSNVDEIARLIFEKDIKPFNYVPPEDEWYKILAKGKSTYNSKEEYGMEVRVEVILNYYDNELGRLVKKGEELTITKKRADELESLVNPKTGETVAVVRVIEVIRDTKKETAKPKARTEKAVRKTTTGKTTTRKSTTKKKKSK